MKASATEKHRRWPVIGILLSAALSVIAAGCTSAPLPPPPAPRAPRPQMEYTVDETFSVLPDKVIQGEKTAVAVSPDRIESNYSGRDRNWTLEKDLSSLPGFSSPAAPLYEALYNMALEEALKDIRGDQAFMAGKQWTGVWTRDISYSIQLSLAHILPENSRASLEAKVNDYDEIIQDTGTGGSWPISTDRIVWAIAAWELYLADGQQDWLERARQVLGNSLERDLTNAVDPATGLIFGETSFLDWREQTYAKWMEPKDIFESKAFSTNLLFARALEIYSLMSAELGRSDDAAEYKSLATRQYALVAKAFARPDDLYSLYLYPPVQGNLPVDKTGALSNALSVLFSASDAGSPLAGGRVTRSLPVVNFGVPTIEPQQPRIPPYHNAGIWPFVEAYYGIAASREHNPAAFEFTLKTMSRSAALFLSNMENMVYDNGHSSGTQINSERQLWSVAGYLGMIYKGLFGIDVDVDGVRIQPDAPDIFGEGSLTLSDYRLRNMVLNIELQGRGSAVEGMSVNGADVAPGSLIPWREGAVNVVVRLKPADDPGSINLIASGIEAPHEPKVRESDGQYSFRNLTAGVESLIWNGSSFNPAPADDSLNPAPGQILSVIARSSSADGRTIDSNLSQWVYDAASAIEVPASSKESYVEINADDPAPLSIAVNVPASGRYYVSYRYSNGNGPINTDNRTAIRGMFLDGEKTATVVLPQRGSGNWGDWGLSSGVILNLEAGDHNFDLSYLPQNRNMNGKVNQARVKSLVLIPLN